MAEMSNRPHTGLNSYILRTLVSKYVIDPEKKTDGFDSSAAYVYLWEPERVAEQLAKVQATMWWAGHLMAVRARP